MIKKRILAGAVIAAIIGGLGVKSIVSFTQSEHSRENQEYYYNKDSSNGVSSKTPNPSSKEDKSSLPSRDSVDTNEGSLYQLVNKEFALSSDYAPEDLVVPDIRFNISYDAEKKYLRSAAADAIEILFKAASEEGYELCGVSGYRSYTRQKEIYTTNLATKGTAHTNKYSAQPGNSEHQSGLAMDVSSAAIGYSLSESFGDTKEGKWLASNCYKYGFIIRYPENKENITGYFYEPWHIRYLGVPLSTYLYENDLTLEEYYNVDTRYDDLNEDSSIMDVDENDLSTSAPSIVITPSPSVQPSYSAPSSTKENQIQNSSAVTPSQSTIPSSSASSETQTTHSNSSSSEITSSKKPSSGNSSHGSSSGASSSPSASKKPSSKPSAPASTKPSTKPSVKPSPSHSVKPSLKPSPSIKPSSEPEDTTGKDESINTPDIPSDETAENEE